MHADLFLLDKTRLTTICDLACWRKINVEKLKFNQHTRTGKNYYRDNRRRHSWYFHGERKEGCRFRSRRQRGRSIRFVLWRKGTIFTHALHHSTNVIDFFPLPPRFVQAPTSNPPSVRPIFGPTPGFPSGGSFNSGSFPSPSHSRNDMPPPSLPYGPGGRIGWSIDWLVDWIAFALCGRWIDWLIDWVCFICCGFCDCYRRLMLLSSVSDYHFDVLITAYGSDLFNFLSR